MIFHLIKTLLYPRDKSLIEIFLNSIPKGRTTFRYFETRPIDVIFKHEYTCLKMNSPKKNIPVAYGHLELDQNKLWLGIAVADKYIGIGYGKKIMLHLIKVAKKINIKNKIYLTSDEKNTNAINLYKKYGFMNYMKKKEVVYMYKVL